MDKVLFRLRSPAFTLVREVTTDAVSPENIDRICETIAYVPSQQIGKYVSIYSDEQLANNAVASLRRAAPRKQWYALKVDNLAFLKKMIAFSQQNGVEYVGHDVEYTSRGVEGHFIRIDELEKPN